MKIYEYLGSRKPLIIMRFTSLISCYPQCLASFANELQAVAYGLHLVYADDLRRRSGNTPLSGVPCMGGTSFKSTVVVLRLL